MRHFALSAFLLCMTAGCGLLGGGSLEQSALKYYQFRLGQSPGISLSSFFNPAYLEIISKDDLDMLNRRLTNRGGVNTRFGNVALNDIFVSVDGNFALTMFDGQQSAGMAANEYIRWVKAGRRWYLYMGSGAEIDAYGLFPVNLGPPQPSKAVPGEPAAVD